MSAWLWGILLSLAPISELRGGIPYMAAQGIDLKVAFLSCVLANLAIIPLIFLFLDHLHHCFLRLKCYRKTFDAFLKRLRKKEKQFQVKYKELGFIALTLFVAVPLPVTGAWTGSLIAWLLGLKRTKAIAAIAAGVLIAGILVSLITAGVLKLVR